jgi:hypothetical protein
VSQGVRERRKRQKIFEEIMSENFPTLMTKKPIYISKKSNSELDKHKVIHIYICHHQSVETQRILKEARK